MKRMKKLASLLLALVMVFSMATTVFAAGTNTIKVTGAQKGETYKVYKMLDLSVDVKQNAYSYTVNSEWNAFFKNSGAGVAYVDIDDQGYVTWKEGKDTAADMETFAKAAAAYVESNSISEVDSITPTEDKDITVCFVLCSSIKVNENICAVFITTNIKAVWICLTAEIKRKQICNR